MKSFSESSIHRRRFLQFSAGAGLAAVLGPAGFARAFQAEKSGLKFLTKSPNNAEPALEELIADWMTPTKLFYIRSHAPNPKIDPNSYRLKVEGLVEKPLELSLEELKQRFKPRSAVATMTCAGNRRSELSEIKPIGGVQWGPGAIGNAEWEGVPLSEVLKSVGLKENARHVWFEGLDEIPEGNSTISFGGSIPLTKALADTDAMPGALLSYNMNGEALTADHGAPLRTVVPGYIGARSVKWLGKVFVSDRPSPNHYVAEAYKLIVEDTSLAWEEAGVIYTYRVNSAMIEGKFSGRMSKIRGYALPTGDGSRIEKVEVSTDNGGHWTKARLLSKPLPYCWTLWEADVPVRGSTTRIVSRATDSKGHTQPADAPWNFKGYMNNGWYKLQINVT